MAPKYHSSTNISAPRQSSDTPKAPPPRMQLRQVVGPKVSAAAVDGTNKMLVLASSASVFVHSLPDLKCTASWTVKHPIATVALSSKAMIAVAHGSSVSIFKPDVVVPPANSDSPHSTIDPAVYSTCNWILWKDLHIDDGKEGGDLLRQGRSRGSDSKMKTLAVLALDWSPDGTKLLMGGSHFAIWNLTFGDSVEGSEPIAIDFVLSWSLVASCPVKKIKYSPDGSLFASVGENDRFVKVWYPGTNAVGSSACYDFVYLTHASAVTNFEWRHQSIPFNSTTTLPTNALLTVTNHSTTRIWCQTSTINTISHSSAENRYTPTAQFEMRATVVPDLGTTSLHWVQGRAVTQAIESSDRGGEGNGLKSASKGRGATAIKDYPDMLFGVGKDGGVVVWGIQGLDGHPQRIPKVLVVLKTQSGVLPGDYEAFMGEVETFCDASVVMASAIHFPAEISILARSTATGLLNLYSMSLDEFFGSPWANPYLRLEHSWCGHTTPVARFSVHPKQSVAASVSVGGEVNFYRISVPQVAIRVNEGLDLISHQQGAGTTPVLIAWIPNHEIAVLCDGTHLLLQEISPTSLSAMDTAVALQDANPLFPITFIHVVHHPERDESLPAGTAVSYLVMGVSREDQCVYFWEVVFEDSKYRSNKLLSESSCISSKGDGSNSIEFLTPTNMLSVAFCPFAKVAAHVFARVSTDGMCCLWGVDWASGGEVKCVKVGEFEMGQGVMAVKVDVFGKFVVARQIEESEWEIGVWQGRIEDAVFSQTWKKTWTSAVVALDITVSSDGQSLIAVATKSGVDVFCQDRLKAFNAEVEWIQVAEMTVPWEDTVTQIAWLQNGSLATILSSKIAVFSKWKDTTTTPSSSSSTSTTPASLFTAVSTTNGRLPDYHPDLLVQYLIWGKFTFMQFVFSLVHKYSKVMDGAGRRMREVPSVLWKFFDGEEGSVGGEVNYDALFMEAGESSGDAEIGNFTQSQLDFLIEMKDGLVLPHLTPEDQARLLAIMSSFVQLDQQKRSVDANGGRFVFFARLLMASSPKGEVLSSRDIAWAFYSDSQDFLVDFVSQSFGGKPLWKDVQSLGMGLWLKNTESLRRQIEAIARNLYMSKEDKDPVDCALFYICLKKKNVLFGLWKLASSHPEQGAMLKFLANDFSEERWQKAAVKNAFALLGKQRYEYAVAFFLLADRLKDAVNVCLKHLKDLQLAIVLCRLFEGDESPTLIETLKTAVLPEAFCEGDRYMISMVFTLLKEKEKAINSTLMPLNTLTESATTDLPAKDMIDPPLVVLHDYLHKTYKSMRVQIDPVSALQQFHFLSASSTIYENMGCPGLALEMLEKAAEVGPAAVVEGTAEVVVDAPVVVGAKTGDTVDAFDWGAPVSAQVEGSVVPQSGSGPMDWGAPVSQQPATGGMDWGAPVSQQPAAGGMDWGAPVSQQPASGGMDWGAPVSQQPAAGGMDWGAPVSQQPASGGMDWGAPVPTKAVDPMDEYEAFKSTLQTNDEPDELELLERELELAELKHSGGAKPAEQVAATNATIVLNDEQQKRLAMIQDAIRYQKWNMAIRMIHSLYKSVAVVSMNMDVLSVDPVFKGYFDLLLAGIKKLAEQAEMPLEVMDSAMTTRFREMDAFIAFVELPCFASNERTAGGFSSLLIEGSNHLSELVFSGAADAEFTSVDPIIDFSKRILWSIVRWYEKEDSGFTPIGLSAMSSTAATAFLSLSICCIKSKDYKAMWWIVGLSDRFFEVLVGGAKKKNLKPLLMDLLTQREPIMQPDSESEDESDDEDYYGEVSAEKALLAETLLSSIALQHIGLDFQVFVRHLKDGGSADDAYGFLSEVVLTKLSALLFEMHENVRSKWTDETKFKVAKLSTYLLNSNAKGVWALIKRTANVKKLAASIVSVDASKNLPPIVKASPDLPSASSDEAPTAEVEPVPKRSIQIYNESDYEVVFRTKDIIGTFAINPLDSNCFVVAIHDQIVEFDCEASVKFCSREEVLAKRRESVDDLAIKSTNKKFLEPPKNPQIQRHAEGDGLRRTLSYGSIQKAAKDSMMDLRRRDSDLDSGRRVQRGVSSVSALESHPSLNYYLAGVGDGVSESVVKLYQFGQKGDLVSYSSGTAARFTKCRFDPFGGRFGCTDAKGDLRLWKFDFTQAALNPTQIIKCNSAITNDFAFINSSSLIATAGVSSNGSNICLWDTLLPPHRSRVNSFLVTEGGAYSIAHTNRYQSIISGGKKGDLFIFDVRQMKHRKTFRAHDSTIKSLYVDDENGFLISGAAGGDIKVWDLSMFGDENWGSDDAALARQGRFPGHSEKLSGVSSYGVMQISVNDNRIYACGADGSLSRCKV
ncbi:regulator of (H+)-ATPase in vacuolar membrane [Podochytrium sp. JEL0797]|nr:regulator of (H+)-ATPase in vacuolar membrane [Podochytrium sp. JEL0797]